MPCWIVPSLNNNTFVNGYTPCQLAHGRQPNVPGLLSDERTSPLQLQTTEQERLYKKLQLRASAHAACAKAEIDVKLRRALLRRFTGQNEDLSPGERCLYWRESNDRFHTIQWRGPAVVLAVQRDPDTNVVDTYWIALQQDVREVHYDLVVHFGLEVHFDLEVLKHLLD